LVHAGQQAAYRAEMRLRSQACDRPPSQGAPRIQGSSSRSCHLLPGRVGRPQARQAGRAPGCTRSPRLAEAAHRDARGRYAGGHLLLHQLPQVLRGLRDALLVAPARRQALEVVQVEPRWSGEHSHCTAGDGQSRVRRGRRTCQPNKAHTAVTDLLSPACRRRVRRLLAPAGLTGHGSAAVYADAPRGRRREDKLDVRQPERRRQHGEVPVRALQILTSWFTLFDRCCGSVGPHLPESPRPCRKITAALPPGFTTVGGKPGLKAIAPLRLSAQGPRD